MMHEARPNPAEDALPKDFARPPTYYLRGRRRRTLCALIEIVVPKNERLQLQCTESLLHYVDNYVRHIAPFLRLTFPLGLWILEWAALITTGSRFSRLDRPRQEAYVRGWALSKYWWKRDLLKGVKGIVLMGFYQLPAVMRAMDYDPADHTQKMIRLRRGTDAYPMQ
jgi:hypothetical protein